MRQRRRRIFVAKANKNDIILPLVAFGSRLDAGNSVAGGYLNWLYQL